VTAGGLGVGPVGAGGAGGREGAGATGGHARVRPYLATRGRTRPVHEIALEALVTATPAGRNRGVEPEPERARILRVTVETRSVAEVAALVDVPIGVARVLVADLAAEGLLNVADPGARDFARDMSVLERVRDGLRRL
jgi:Protein of unknown function (DUF742)